MTVFEYIYYIPKLELPDTCSWKNQQGQAKDGQDVGPLQHSSYQPLRAQSAKLIHCKKKVSLFPSPAGMSMTKLSLGRNNQIIPVQGEFDQWHPSWGREKGKPFLQCSWFHKAWLNSYGFPA